MLDYNQYETQFLSVLFFVQERPGAYIGSPSIEKLLNFIVGYEVAVYQLTGYRIVMEQEFRRFLSQKYNKEDWECSFVQFFQDGKTDEEGFDAFFEELKHFCQEKNIHTEKNV